MVGLSHKKAAIEVREQFFLQPAEREHLLLYLKNEPAVVEAIVLSTCNRTEIYAWMIQEEPDLLIKALAKIRKLTFTPNMLTYFDTRQDEEAVRHLFRVTCGLESLVIGEKQILGQVKEASELARRWGMMGKSFNILTNLVIRAGKLAQEKTSIGAGGSSVSWAAVATADVLLNSLEQKSVLIIGAGKMSQLTIQQLMRKSVSDIYVMNRTKEKAAELAGKVGGHAVTFWEMKDVLSRVDVCICSSGAPHYLVDPDLMAQVMVNRQGRPIVLIDISTPRNIDPAVGQLPSVRLLTIDELEKVVSANMEHRQVAIADVENIIQTKLNAFYQKIRGTDTLTPEPVGQAN